MQEAVIVSAVRTAVGKAPNGALRGRHDPTNSAATAIAEALRRAPGIDPSEIDDVILGCAMPEAEQGMNVARIASLRAGVPISASAVTINRFCSSGLQAIAFAAERIMCGSARAIIAGGTESMSMIPMGGHTVAPNPSLSITIPTCISAPGSSPKIMPANRDFARRAGRLRVSQPPTRDRGDRRRPIRRGDRSGHGSMSDPGAGRRWRRTGAGSDTADSFQFKVDEGPRRDTSTEALAKLRPAFHVAGSVTAGNSSQTSDGASALIVTSGELARERGLAAAGPLRRVHDRGRRTGTVWHRARAGDSQIAQIDRADTRSD